MAEVSINGNDFGNHDVISQILSQAFSYNSTIPGYDTFVYSYIDSNTNIKYTYRVETTNQPDNELRASQTQYIQFSIGTSTNPTFYGYITIRGGEQAFDSVVDPNYAIRGGDKFNIYAPFHRIYGDYSGSDFSHLEELYGNDVFILHTSTAITGSTSEPYGVFGDSIVLKPDDFAVFGNDMINASRTTNAMRLIGDTTTASDLAIYGNDLIYGGSGIDQIFGDSVESPQSLRNGGDDRLFGGGGIDQIFAGGGDDWIDGGAQDDYLYGGYGNDTFVVDSAGDQVFEVLSFDGGFDTVQSSVTFTLAYFVEGLTLTGTANINGIGSKLNNVLVGNSGNNILNGVAGADNMSGGEGNDTYYVDNAGDVVAENFNSGNDTVFARVSYTIGDDIEGLRLEGNASSATGNGLANLIMGSALANTIYGLDGSDTLYGYEGNDLLHGGTGQDRFCFNTALGAGNVDTIGDFVVADDTVLLRTTIFTAAGATGTLAATAYKEIGYSGAAAIDGNDRIIHNRATGDIFYDADGSNAGAAVLFAKVGAGLIMTNADFTMF